MFFCCFYCQDSIKSSLKSSALLHFRNSKLKNSPIKPVALDSGFQTSISAPPNQKELPTALIIITYLSRTIFKVFVQQNVTPMFRDLSVEIT